MPSLRQIVLIDPDAPDVLVWFRGDDGTWARSRVEGLKAAVGIASLGLSHFAREIYEEIEFSNRPTLALP